MIAELNIPENFGEAIFSGPEIRLALEIERAGRLKSEFLDSEQLARIQKGLRDKIALYRLDHVPPGRGKLDDDRAMKRLLDSAASLANASLKSHSQQEATSAAVEELL